VTTWVSLGRPELADSPVPAVADAASPTAVASAAAAGVGSGAGARFYAQMQLMMSLVDLGDRLIAVPRESRRASSATRAARVHVTVSLPRVCVCVCVCTWVGGRGGGEGTEATLEAELSLLSHNLPARTCIPFFCPDPDQAPDAHAGHGGEGAGHPCVVRMGAREAVVLNSKERVRGNPQR
jgi:hypothetical protein